MQPKLVPFGTDHLFQVLIDLQARNSLVSQGGVPGLVRTEHGECNECAPIYGRGSRESSRGLARSGWRYGQRRVTSAARV